MESIDFQRFYPEDLEIKEMEDTADKIIFKMKSYSKQSKCPKCGIVSRHHHGTYERKVQDLPILGKGVELHVKAYDYQCDEESCSVKSFAESFDNFIDNYSRKTERLSKFICTTALETSCEGCSRICKSLNINISGDSIIRLLIRKYQELPEVNCGPVVGVDDFAFKKRETYGTIIVDETTHKTITVLEGRDGSALKEWLRHNQHVKVVTRDRASAYAAAINEVLPNAMQVADRFHLYQNFLEAVRNILNGELLATVKISNNVRADMEDSAKKENC